MKDLLRQLFTKEQELAKKLASSMTTAQLTLEAMLLTMVSDYSLVARLRAQSLSTDSASSLDATSTNSQDKSGKQKKATANPATQKCPKCGTTVCLTVLWKMVGLTKMPITAVSNFLAQIPLNLAVAAVAADTVEDAVAVAGSMTKRTAMAVRHHQVSRRNRPISVTCA
jgi:hypothetical protein